MRNSLPLLLLPAMILATPACLAQAREAAPRQGGQAVGAAQEAQGEVPDRSAFGRVMAVMIDALKQDSLHQQALQQQAPRSGAAGTARAAAGTTAIGTPLGIEVGEAFRLDERPPPPRPLAVQDGSGK